MFGGGGATVGDSTNPIRGGNLIITFDVDSTSGNLTQDIASITGSVSGTGLVIFNEIIEDRTPGNQGVIGSADLLLNGPTPNPATIVFSRGSSSIKVKKTLVFSASPSELVDNATVTLLRQTIVPSPGSMALLGIGSLGLLGRRRRS
ncbi:MAG: PEP-CTERM sorting domain-containing protein [Phycisphaerales bacterium]|nr:MAG: PEP-CTERM sorting domain-containing protein [Phycisphaerales bacterium]